MSKDPKLPAAPPREPRRRGRYDVERLLGEGGMGRVWLGRDSVLGRRVAIKTLRDDLALAPSTRDELVQRMRHEARAAAAMSHPNIVTLHDMGEDAGFGLFLVFEYVPGPPSPDEPQSLRDRLRTQGPLGLEELAKLARELGAALTFAHEAGVVHRDVKPENVLFSRTGAKIADFGIARIPESTITRANTVLGTPAYTSPEALSYGTFSPLSDQFSLAATLYEAATGTRAFAGSDAIETAGKVSNDAPPPLEQRLGESVTVRAIDAVLARGLAKEASARFGSCIGLGEALARAVEPAGLGPTLRMSERLSAPPTPPDPFERTPLSSRVTLSSRVSERPPVPGEIPAPLPSVIVRRQTQRSQNVAAGLALLVILGLVAFGRKDDDARRRAREAPASTASAAPVSAPSGPRAPASKVARTAAVVAPARPTAVAPAAPAPAALPPTDAADAGP
jgi:serine/threonine-protein kinase